MKFVILILAALTAVTASAAEIQMNARMTVGLNLKTESPMSLRDAKCALISSQLFRCVLPVNLPKVTGLGTEQTRVTEMLGDADNKILTGLYRIETKLSGQLMYIDFPGQLVTQLLDKAYPYNPKEPEAYSKRIKNLNDILVNERQLLELEEPFKLELQKTKFPKLFSTAEEILKYLIEENKIYITQYWTLDFKNEESTAMVKDFCASDKNQENPTCKALSALGK